MELEKKKEGKKTFGKLIILTGTKKEAQCISGGGWKKGKNC